MSSSESPSKKQKMTTSVDTTCINTIRCLGADIVQKANSGHPGAPMGCAPMAHTLFNKVMRYSPSNPKWFNRDRFVLSNGHSCALLYTMLHLTGYERPSMSDLQNFRQLNSVTAGHPENYLLDGVEVSTGPLGQGISNAVGLAIAEAHLAARFNQNGLAPLVDHSTYVICGDGCLQEGVSSEACSLAGHLKLGKLIVLYDDNDITIDGGTNLSFTEDVAKRFESYGWHVQTVADGNSTDTSSLESAVAAARAVTDKPSIIKVKTIIGLGSAKQGTHSVHGAPLGAEDISNVKTKFGFDPSQSFQVPDVVREAYGSCVDKGNAAVAEWNALLSEYKSAVPELMAEFERRMNGTLPDNWMAALPRYTPGQDKDKASRNYSQDVINALAPLLPEMMGGSADLTPSNKTNFKGCIDFQADTPHGRYLRFGVREHGMAAICNGMAAHGSILPYCATFLNFVGYALGAIRVTSLSHFRVIYVMTHDSIGLGEDGPTHQPVETLCSLRAMPNHLVIRPADGNETSGAYAIALANPTRPCTLALSRQTLVHQTGSSIENTMKGAYVLLENANAVCTLIATGSEVQLCMNAAAEMGNVRVVSMPCWELFEEQSNEYQQSVLGGLPVVSVEAGATTGWERYSHAHIGMRTFGASAPGSACFEHFGFTVNNIKNIVGKVTAHYSNGAPTLMLNF
jgi:transketolase